MWMLASQGSYDKMVPYAEAVDIPLLIRWPKHIRAGSKSDASFTPIDFLPTLASLRGLPIPAIVNGMDLAGPVLGRGGPERDAALSTIATAISSPAISYAEWFTPQRDLIHNALDLIRKIN